MESHCDFESSKTVWVTQAWSNIIIIFVYHIYTKCGQTVPQFWTVSPFASVFNSQNIIDLWISEGMFHQQLFNMPYDHLKQMVPLCNAARGAAGTWRVRKERDAVRHLYAKGEASAWQKRENYSTHWRWRKYMMLWLLSKRSVRGSTGRRMNAKTGDLVVVFLLCTLFYCRGISAWDLI